MIYPDRQTIEAFRTLDDIIGHNIDNLLADFLETSKPPFDPSTKLTASQEQAIVNVMFTSYVMGTLSAVNPRSNFNTKFRSRKPEASA